MYKYTYKYVRHVIKQTNKHINISHIILSMNIIKFSFPAILERHWYIMIIASSDLLSTSHQTVP